MSDSLRARLALAICCALTACRHSTPDEATSQSGERIFTTVCARCHGLDGKGGPASGSANAPRNFSDAAFQASRTDAE
ncbi:MAG TPA: cytochrome c, partial [Polyangiaceae bacterium]|nr:cytochrome c [Polyangiaceae bacterium]